jgi:hypothetical protein
MGNVTDKAKYTLDSMHFWANVNQKLNEQLFQLLQEIKKKVCNENRASRNNYPDGSPWLLEWHK